MTSGWVSIVAKHEDTLKRYGIEVGGSSTETILTYAIGEPDDVLLAVAKKLTECYGINLQDGSYPNLSISCKLSKFDITLKKLVGVIDDFEKVRAKYVNETEERTQREANKLFNSLFSGRRLIENYFSMVNEPEEFGDEVKREFD